MSRVEAISDPNWLRNRIPSTSRYKRIYLRIEKPALRNVLKFGQWRYAFECKSDKVRGKKLLPRSLFSHFVGKESAESLYRVYIPSRTTITLCRVADFTTLNENTSLTSMATLLDNLSTRRVFEEHNTNIAAATDSKDTLFRYMFTMHSQTSFSGKEDQNQIKGLSYSYRF